jgi:acyl-CoA synthetase (AMP-forming)/AMP-acid ligase II
VRSPKRLLQAVDRHRGTLSWLPNFAYNHCVRAISRRDLDGLDLGSWRAVINCSEPVRHDSHRQFWNRFAPHGLRESAVSSCYAMAENTFAVTQSAPGVPPTVDWVDLSRLQGDGLAVPRPNDAPGVTSVVSCGRPIAGTAVKIVDRQGLEVPERTVGEIALRGDSMLQGYHRRPELSGETIRDGWYHTGDMGYLADGELYVCGRSKDLIIVGGKNLYPQDLEAIANTVPGIHPGRAVAFGADNRGLGSESIVLVCETSGPEADHAEIVSTLRRRLVEEADVTASDVRLVGRRWVLKTSSGKLARAANRDKYLASF